MEERENKREETASDAELQRLVEDFITQKQVLLIQVKKGVLGKEEFLQEAGKHIDQYYHFPATKRKRLLKSLNNIFSVIPDCHRSWMTKAFRISGW